MACWRWAGLLIATATICFSGSARARLVELTFDDGESGTGTATGHELLNNLETRAAQLGTGIIGARFIGVAERSSIDAGAYGRAADFSGGAGGIELTGLDLNRSMWFSLFAKARSTAAGSLVARAGSVDVKLTGGTIQLVAEHSQDGPQTFDTGATLPSDGAFHHVLVTFAPSAGSLQVRIAIDWQLAGSATTSFVPSTGSAPVRVGEGFDGLMDELLVGQGSEPDDNAIFDWNAAACPEGLVCTEEVITTTPRDFPREVPVRLKSVRDPAQCNESSPCRLTFDISGGNNCADDYAPPYSVEELARAGLFVVTADVYCEASGNTQPHPTETSQLIAAVEHVRNVSTLSRFVAGSDYSATGCSHGAGLVTQWAIKEQDHPTRTFARSAGAAGLCALFAGKLCPAVVDAYSANNDAGVPEPDDPAIMPLHERSEVESWLTPELTADRDFARSWGVNLEGPICTPDGYGCNEEGQWGMTYSSRRFRDIWRTLEPADAPTGYFVEDSASDCKHCAGVKTKAFQCGLCLLVHGRSGMEQSCPECLTYQDPTIDEGPEAEPCPIEVDGYDDPLFPEGDAGAAGAAGSSGSGGSAGSGGNAGSGGADAGVPQPDGGTPAASAASQDSGCGCRLPARGGPPGAALLAAGMLALLAARRRRD